ncbi:polyphosphate kinase 2 family protein [uncultured Methanoregula sp.]|uniref:polyphosphate kinase 2 family protein n=1 Tax=uncultured Methanoregula sp. TaxID=1005933 RepID=UPI002AAAF10B|nr:polyphosphate kinase 2 family protein [uncultured Methanoregula sp.]
MELTGPEVKDYIRPFLVKPGKKVQLKKYDTGWAHNEFLKKLGEEGAKGLLTQMLERDRVALAEAQELFFASRQYSLLIILQGMDTSGKDGTIRHVMSGVNPQGCAVNSFKVPSSEDHAHDFLWRYFRLLPERGMIGIFNRSYYEDVLAVRVHPERMEALPKKIGPGSSGFWEGRFKDINAFEKHLRRNGTIILKFFLNISKEEQKRRLLDRLEHKEKYWKFSAADLAERQYWEDYMKAYGEMLSATSTDSSPWFIVPADYKWVARTVVAEAITSTIGGLSLAYPEVTDDQFSQLMAAKKELLGE